ncbi:MAG: hypothetical protein AAF919_17500 [Pseudomonadota bacterium]
MAKHDQIGPGTGSAPGGSSAGPELPFDRTEWEARLAVARAQREAVLQQRALGKQPDAAPEMTDGTVPKTAPSTRRPSVLRAPARPVADDLPEIAPPARVNRPAVLWLALGCVVGATIAGSGVLGAGLAEIQRRVAAVAPSGPPPATPATVIESAMVAPTPEGEETWAPNVRTAASEAPATPPGLAKPDATQQPLVGQLATRDPLVPVAVVMDDPATIPTGSRDGVAALTAALRASPPEPGPPALEARPAPRAPAPDALPGATDDAAVPAAPPRPERLVVQAPRNMSADQREAALARLEQDDWAPDTAVTSPFTISQTHVRYYHAADRPSAEALAALFDAEARDFTNFRPAPDDGLVELWLSGQGTQHRAVIRSRHSNSVSRQAARDLAQSRAAIRRFLNELSRAGSH